MKKSNPNIFTCFVIFALIPVIFLLPVAGTAQDKVEPHKRIIEEVDVTNSEIALRVFEKGNPVPGLQKTDFKLLVNGKEKEINGFYEIEKDISVPTSPRLFVLIFNICDFRLEIENSLDIFFDRVYKPKDRLIVITKNFFIDDKNTLNPTEEKVILKRILQVEAGKAKENLRALEQRLKSLVTSYKMRENNIQKGYNNSNANDFLNTYTAMVREFKDYYLDITADKYIQLAKYLKEQNNEKWVLSFYQVGKFLKPKFGSDFYKSLQDANITMGSGMTDAFALNDLLRESFDPANTIPLEETTKLFLNTGATFHSIVMEHWQSVLNDFSQDLTYTPVISDTYNLLKQLASKSGGRFLNSNEFEPFYQQVMSAKDIHYILTYVPEKNASDGSEKIKIISTNKKYKVYFDDRKKGGYYQRLLKKVETADIPIHIENVTFEKQTLSFVVSDFKPAEVVKLPVRIQVFNDKSQSIFDGVRMFEVKEAIKGKVNLQIGFPMLPPGAYEVFIWVGDPLAGQRALAVKDINL